MTGTEDQNVAGIKAAPRNRALDLMRGYVMVYTVFLLRMNPHHPSYPWFFEHAAANGRTMSYPDLGVGAFLWLMGMSMVVSFVRRKRKLGTAYAVRQLLVRYAILLMAGVALQYLGQRLRHRGEPPVYFVAGLPVVPWDVLHGIGLAGMVAALMMVMPPRRRALVAAAMLIFYQFMLMRGGWRLHSLASVHGGWLAAAFSLGAVTACGSCMGEWLLLPPEIPVRRKAILLALVSAGVGLAGLTIHALPGMYANKHTATLAWALICMAATGGHYLVWMLVEERKIRNPLTTVLEAVGSNALLTYLVGVVMAVTLVGYWRLAGAVALLAVVLVLHTRRVALRV